MKKVKYQCWQPQLNGVEVTGYDFSSEDWLNLWTQYPAIKTNSWYNSLPNRTGEVFNRAKAKVQQMKRDRLGLRDSNLNPTLNTARICPNIREFLSRCMVVRAPMDIHFARAEGKLGSLLGHDYYYEMEASEPYVFHTETHEPSQFRSDACDTFKDHINIKIPTRITLDLPKGMQCMFLQPFYDNPNAPFQQITGVFTEPLNHNANLIVNWMVHKDVEDFMINKGDALMYVYFPERVKFVENKGTEGLLKTKWNKPKGLVSPEVQKKCPRMVD